jgi:SHS2 domain-containing protein
LWCTRSLLETLLKILAKTKIMKYEYFEHTADVKFKAHGKNLEEAFSNAALAMFNVMFEHDKVKENLRKNISVNGKDLKSLLYNYLEELLFLLDSEHFLLSGVERVKIDRMGDRYVLTSMVVGDKAGNYETAGDVKAVTYNEMEIKEDPSGCYVQVVLDI